MQPTQPVPVTEPDVVHPPTPIEEPQPDKGPDLPQPGPDVVVPPGPEVITPPQPQEIRRSVRPNIADAEWQRPMVDNRWALTPSAAPAHTRMPWRNSPRSRRPRRLGSSTLPCRPSSPIRPPGRAGGTR